MEPNEHKRTKTEEDNVKIENSMEGETSKCINESILQVDVSDALVEADKVLFTIRTRTSEHDGEPGRKFCVTRTHEDFIWLHSVLEENITYGGLIIPPKPPKPDFQHSQERLSKMGAKESHGGRIEFTKVKQDLEAEYLAAFKKTVAQHEGFLHRIVFHPTIRNDWNLKIFLQYEQDLEVREKNMKEKISDFFNMFQRSGDELLLSSVQNDGDTTFENEKIYLLEYHNRLKASCIYADKMSSAHKAMSSNYSKLSSLLTELIKANPQLESLAVVCEGFDKVKKIEGRLANDQELKLADTLRFHVRDTGAAKDLLYRRLRALANYQIANRELHLARAKNKDKLIAETVQKEAWEKFERLTEVARGELELQKKGRISSFQKNVCDLAELEVKHGRAHCEVLRQLVTAVSNCD